MIGKQRSGITYYRCKTTHADPRTQERFPDHPNTVSVREDVLHAAVEGFFTDHMFGSDRAALLAQHFSEATARAHAEHVQHVAGLEARVTAAEQAKRRLVREIERYPTTTRWPRLCAPTSAIATTSR